MRVAMLAYVFGYEKGSIQSRALFSVDESPSEKRGRGKVPATLRTNILVLV